MGQLYMQRFENRGVIDKSDFDATLPVGLEAFRKAGNVDKGVTGHGVFAASWYDYVLIDVDSPETFAEYQAFHYNNCDHHFAITFEPVVNMEDAFAETSQ